MLEQRFTTSRRQCRRWEADGQKVTVTRRTETTPYMGKDYPTTVEIWTGPHYLDNGTVRLCDRSSVADSGPALGTALTFTEARSVLDAERRENRGRLDAAVRQILPGYALEGETA